jgi:hypothetical protein
MTTDSPEFNRHTSRPSTLSSAGALAMSDIYACQPHFDVYDMCCETRVIYLELDGASAWEDDCSETE